MSNAFIFYKQLNAMDCGPTCLRMIARHYGKKIDKGGIKQNSGLGKNGVSLLGLSDAAENYGFRTRGVQLTYEQLIKLVPLPCILHLGQSHFVVMISYKSNFLLGERITIADPAVGITRIKKEEFQNSWFSTRDDAHNGLGTALLLEPTAHFFDSVNSSDEKMNWKTILKYVGQNRWPFIQVMLALFITSLFQLVIPFLTQSIVDNGINTQNIQYITVILAAQLMLIFSRTIIDFIRGKILLFISVNINISILSDFWIKLTRLPISYFDSYHSGDTIQRLADSRNIEKFLTGNALSTFFSVFSFLIFSFVLSIYSTIIFYVFCIGSVLYFIWISLFLRYRRKVNYKMFHLSAKENLASLQMIQGMQELKLNNAEGIKRWEWENIQASVFKLGFRNLTYNQLQQAGAIFINEGKNAIVMFLVAQLVIQGKLSIGAMLAIQYIIGQLNSPVEQFIGFIQTFQDAKLSLERLNEIHSLKDEEESSDFGEFSQSLPERKSISLKDVSFTYPGAGNEPVLKNINLDIPDGKTTAIVGVSGSGKTTLIKLLLKFYEQYQGEIQLGEDLEDKQNTSGLQFKYISPSFWRSQCGAVLQDGFIFNDTIAKNIAVGFEQAEITQLVSVCKIANILEFIQSLPNGFNTKIGVDGVGISQGQKQRLLIARAIYKDPPFLFFDEATNSLDSNNEKAITENLNNIFKGKTVIVVAHRLSTVKNSDKIIVLNKGEICEQGTHTELTVQKGKYYELIKNQLELGN